METTTQTAKVLDSWMTYREQGRGPAVVFLHGNPTSSYLWRNVIPHVSGQARGLAPDLIGMGESGKPDIGYRFADHARYLDAWLDTTLPDGELIFVGHDWGGALAQDWAARHDTGRVRGIALIETFLRPLAWSEMAPQAAELFRAFRTQGVGEEMVLEQNAFIERNLPRATRNLAPDDLAVYRALYPRRGREPAPTAPGRRSHAYPPGLRRPAGPHRGHPRTGPLRPLRRCPAAGALGRPGRQAGAAGHGSRVATVAIAG
jgi:pimeloyl-ACP methyl ester carboxylesterase